MAANFSSIERSMAPAARTPRPLVVRCGAFGDMVLVTALIGELGQRFGVPVDVLTSGPWSDALLRGQPGVGAVWSVRSRKTPYWLSADQRRAVKAMRARGVGPTWLCDGNDAARPMLVRAGVGPDDIVDVKDHPLRPGEHATQQWRRLAKVLPAALRGGHAVEGGDTEALVPGGCRLWVDDAQRADLTAWLERRRLSDVPLIAVQAGNKRTMRRGLKRLAANHKYWPAERWAFVLRHVRLRHPGHAIILLGAVQEYALNQELAALAGIDGLVNAADDLPVRRLVALLARSRGMISVDSGPAHAAAAVDCPVVVLFGKASTSLYRPWGMGGADVKVLTGQRDGVASMLGIEAERVVAAWDGLLLRDA